MLLVHVAPLETTKKLGILSYFTSSQVTLGDLVEITIRKRDVRGIVVSIHNLKDEKMSIKQSNFEIKKINKIIKSGAIDKKIIEEIHYVASTSGTTSTHIIDSLIPRMFLDSIAFTPPDTTIPLIPQCIFSQEREVFAHIKSITREIIAKNKTVAVITPTVVSAQAFYTFLSEGVENKTKLFHGELTPTKQEAVQKSLKKKGGSIICMTPSLAFLADKEIDMVIFYDENSKYYSNHISGLNMKTIIGEITQRIGLQTVYAGIIPSIETYAKLQDQYYNPLHVYLHYNLKDKVRVIKMNSRDEQQTRNPSVYISPELHTHLSTPMSKKIFLYVQRKGAYTTSVCRDCGEIKKCPTCDKPLILKQLGERRIYHCNTCKQDEEILPNKEILCAYCHSWRIETLGIGTQGVYEHIRAHYPELELFIMDGDSIKTKKDAITTYTAFENAAKEKPSVLLGTELALPLLKDIHIIGVVSMDTLFSIPEYSLDQEIAETCIQLYSKLVPQGAMYIQTRLKEVVFDYIVNENLSLFFEKELEQRRKNNLPPFATILTYDTPHNQDATLPPYLESYTHYKVSIVKKNIADRKPEKVIRTIVILPTTVWQDENELRQKCVQDLSPLFLQVNPRSMFS